MSVTAANRAPFPAVVKSETQTKRIRQLADTFEPDDIATMLGISMAEVEQALSTAKRSPWWGRCNKTGRTVKAYSWRGVYRLAQVAGWTDWEHGKGTIGDGVTQ